VQQTEPAIKALWLETFTDSLKGLLHTNLNINAKEESAGIFFIPGALSKLLDCSLENRSCTDELTVLCLLYRL
jgi:hypothetical protein